MEVHAAPAVGKRLWSYVRAALFMARNGKRKLLLTMHFLGASTKKRRGATKPVARAVANLLSHGDHGHHANSYALRRGGGDYEFSCTNSPAACSSSSSSSRRRLAYFPCLAAVAEEDSYEYGYGYQSDADAAEPVPPLARIDYYASAAAAGASSPAPGEEEEEECVYACTASPASASSPALQLPGAASSGEFSVRVSNYSSEDDDDEAAGAAVDDDAEEFIRRFYDQLRRQNTVAALLPNYTQTQQESITAAA